MMGQRRPTFWGRFVRLAGLVLALLLFLAVATRRESVVGMGQPIQFDDFAFQVTGVRRIDATGPGGRRYVVALTVVNRAKRVDFHFRRESAVLVDRRGREYRPTG